LGACSLLDAKAAVHKGRVQSVGWPKAVSDRALVAFYRMTGGGLDKKIISCTS